MILPCITCKFKTVRRVGFRSYYGCNDPEKKKANFHEDKIFYRHTCNAYVNEDEDNDDVCYLM